jgi:hypothetical protein
VNRAADDGDRRRPAASKYVYAILISVAVHDVINTITNKKITKTLSKFENQSIMLLEKLMGTGGSSPVVKRPRREAHHLTLL